MERDTEQGIQIQTPPYRTISQTFNFVNQLHNNKQLISMGGPSKWGHSPFLRNLTGAPNQGRLELLSPVSASLQGDC